MASNNPSNTTDTHERLPSQVPNDMDRLGLSTEVNMTLSESRRSSRVRRRQARRRRRGRWPNWLKAILALMGIMSALGVVAIVMFLIMFPPYFREHIEPRYQQRIIEMFPPATHWMPTRPFEELPTLSGGSDSSAAQQLLLTQESGLGAGGDGEQHLSTGDDGSAGGTPTPAPVTPSPTGEMIEGLPVGALPTQEPLPTDLPVWSSPTPQMIAPTWTPNFVPTEAPLPVQARLSNPIKYELQGWNNCGPTTMTMALSHYGWRNDQYVAANWMKPNVEDKNVSPWQMVRFVNDVAYESLGVRALYRYGGTITVLKRLLAAGFPVVIEESIQPEGEGWMGHYVLLIGYDDIAGEFLSYDSYLGYNQGQGRALPYAAFDDKWRHFNRIFMVLYRPAEEDALRAALGPYVDKVYGYQVALETARAEASMKRDEPWPWFNMGTSYTLLGDYENAAIAYDLAFQLGLPFRMLWYQFGPYEAYYHTGRYSDVHFYTNATVATTPDIEESYYWKGMAYAAEGNSSAAIEQFNLALRYNRNFFDAQTAKEAVQSGTFTVAARP